jgi:phenylalanyl-tRNA synthetase beta chain
MKVPVEWLKEYIDIPVSIEDLAELLTNTGTAVESIDYPGREIQGVVTARVISLKEHPRAASLKVCTVDWGEGEKEVVCGAPNVFSGALVAVARPGAILPGGREIREVSIKGVRSCGMICSGEELGVNDDGEGILLLEDNLPLGEDFVKVYGLDEPVLDLEITPNRPDCLSLLGIAREIAAITGTSYRSPRVKVEEATETISSCFDVEILDPDLCPRYVARMIRSIKIGASPLWMQRRLKLAGIRPINNVVDVTNYVMLEFGQPLHAFDADKIADNRIIVRRAERGEEITTLDGVRRVLDGDELLICDPIGPIALAGVMGGENTEVSPSTVNVLLESAYFSPASISRTSRKQELHSEASYRFERGVDSGGCPRAADRAIEMMRELAGGSVLAGSVDRHPGAIAPVQILLRQSRVSRILGVEIDIGWIKGALEKLGVREIAGEAGHGEMRLEVPTYRPDLEREIDLIEEIARIYGYQKIPSTLPESRMRHGRLKPEQKKVRKMRRLLSGLGLYEIISYSFVSPERNQEFEAKENGVRAVRLANPLSDETSEMRTSLYPGLLQALAYNYNRKVVDLSIFEIGRVYLGREGEKLPEEKLALGIALMGNWEPRQWDSPPRRADFYTLKGIWEHILKEFGERGSITRVSRDYFHPRISVALQVKGEEVGEMGMLHPLLLRRWGLPPGIVTLHLDLERFIHLPAQAPLYRQIPRFPPVQMDLSLIVAEETELEKVVEVIRSSGGDLLGEVRLFDLYRGEQVGKGQKSLTFSLTFCHTQRTLKEEEAKASLEAIIAALCEQVGARIRKT